MVMTIPEAGLIDTWSVAPGCTITFAPSAAASLTGKYNDGGTWTMTGAGSTVPISTSAACGGFGTGAGAFKVAYTLSPAVFDQG
jgi:hypothetical protein